MGNTPTNQKQKKQIEKYIFVQILWIIFYNLLLLLHNHLIFFFCFII
jgi:hypothetical protein